MTSSPRRYHAVVPVVVLSDDEAWAQQLVVACSDRRIYARAASNATDVQAIQARATIERLVTDQPGGQIDGHDGLPVPMVVEPAELVEAIADRILHNIVSESDLAILPADMRFRFYYEEPITVLGLWLAMNARTGMFLETAGQNYGPVLTEFANGIGTIYVDPVGDAAISERIYRRILNEQFFPEIEREVRARAKTLLTYARSLRTQDFSTQSNDALADRYLEFAERFMQMRMYSSLPTAMEHETNRWTEHLTQILQPKIADSQEFNRAFSLVTSPEATSFVNEYELAVAHYGLAKLAGSATEADLQALIERYAWVHYTFEGMPITAQDIEAKLAALGGTKQALTQFIDEFSARPVRLQQKKKAIYAKYQLTLDEIEACRIGAEIVFIKFYRKGVFAESYYNVEFLLRAIGERIGCTQQSVANMLPEEVLAGLAFNEFPNAFVEQRRASSVFMSEAGHTAAFPLSVRKFYADKLERAETTAELKGQTAQPGVVTGTVRVVNLPSEMEKLKEGEILVSRSTNPSLVPAMRRAAGFITDLGGLTCHAAIVAREMKKPCIVGTKSATQQLKDGDRVTLDANTGTVTKE